MHELALFAGAGGGILGGRLLGWRTVCAVEINAYCAERLMQRQNEGHLPPFPIWDDVCTFDGRPWRGLVDVVSGGFPCQDISAAGSGEGITGPRSGLWKQYVRILRQVRPAHVLVENSPVLTSRGLGVVLGDLAALGYDAQWGVLGACDAIWAAGTPCLDHERFRIWIVAHSHAHGAGWQRADAPQSAGRVQGVELAGSSEVCTNAPQNGCHEVELPIGNGSIVERLQPPALQPASGSGTHAARQRLEKRQRGARAEQPATQGGDSAPLHPHGREQGRLGDHVGHDGAESAPTNWWGAEPSVGRVAHGVAHRVDRCAAIGNGQVPAVVRLAWEILKRS